VIGLLAANPLSPLEDLLRHVLDWLHGSVGLPWAWSIVALTVIVRMLLVPLTVKQIHSMQNLQRHAPQLKEIQKKYKHDKARQNEELMKFYKENKINPAASCLPMIAQLPVFFALYFVLNTFSKHPPEGNLSWLGVLPSVADKTTDHWFGYVMLVVYVVSQMSSTYFMATTMEKMQRNLMMALPLFAVFFIIRFPAGLLLYWVTTNLWTVGQGLITRRLIPKPEAPPKRSSRSSPKDEGGKDGGDAGNGAKKTPAPPKPAAPAKAPQAPRPQGARPVKKKKRQAPRRPR
jgi:YidC/Oxa1 family membrane protein insertase